MLARGVDRRRSGFLRWRQRSVQFQDLVQLFLGAINRAFHRLGAEAEDFGGFRLTQTLDRRQGQWVAQFCRQGVDCIAYDFEALAFGQSFVNRGRWVCGIGFSRSTPRQKYAAHHLAADAVAAFVQRNAAEPEFQWPIGIIAFQAPPGRNQAFLQHVLRFGIVMDVTMYVTVKPFLVPRHQRRERALVAAERGGNQGGIAGAGKAHGVSRISISTTFWS